MVDLVCGVKPLAAVVTADDVSVGSPVGGGHLVSRPSPDAGGRGAGHLGHRPREVGHRVQQPPGSVLSSLQTADLTQRKISVIEANNLYTSASIN